MDTSFMVFEALFSPQEPLKVKDSSKILKVNFSIFRIGPAVNVLTDPYENFEKPQKCPDVL